jgi:predicted permease
METLWKDLRYGWRQIAERPLIAAAAILSIALGIGANTAVFTFANAILLQPLPVSEPDRLVAVFSTLSEDPALLPIAFHDFEDFRRGNQAFTDLAAHRILFLDLTSGDRAERIQGEIASGSYFKILGVEAALGRTFLPEEDGAPGAHPVAVLSHGLWQRQFASDPNVVGREIRLNGHVFKVIGVTPRDFKGSDVFRPPDLWVPMAMHDQVLTGDLRRWFDSRAGLLFEVLGRLKPGVSVQAATASLKGIASEIARQYPDDATGRSITLVKIREAMVDPNVRGNYLRGGTLLLGAAFLLFLIACANVAGLLLTRAMGRRKEMAIRISLGATPKRLTRQLLTEGMILSVLGGFSGLFVAAASRNLLWSLRPPNWPESLNLGMGWRALGFALLLSLFAGVLLGLVPALQSFQASLVPHLKNDAAGSEPRRLTLRKSLVVLQIALSVLLLTGSALCVMSLRNVRAVDFGFNPERLILISFSPGAQGYGEAVGRQLYDRVLERVEQLRGVKSATLGQSVPLVAGRTKGPIVPEGKPKEDYKDKMTGINIVAPRYFETLGIPLREGRVFDATDRQGSRPVVVINETMARELWPGESALGKRVKFEGEDQPAEVVGIVADSTYDFLGEGRQPYCFRPLGQRYSAWMTLHVRTAGDPATVLPTVRKGVEEVARSMPLYNVRSMSTVIEQSLWAQRMAAWLLTSFGILALVLATIGVYGIVAYSVSQRGHEFSVRLAIGAQRRDILRLVYLQGAALCAAGAALGLTSALASRPLLLHFLYGVSSPQIVGIASSIALFLIALAAIYLPARKATLAAPVQALRGGGR